MDKIHISDQYMKENPDATAKDLWVFLQELSEEIANILLANERIEHELGSSAARPRLHNDNGVLKT